MSWYQNILPEGIKKNVCAYLLQRYLGQFFEEKLTREQLNIDLYNGTGTVEKISLDVQALNELSEKQNWPIEFVDGFIDKLFVSVPFMSILKDPSYVEVQGLKITVQPKQRHESATSMFESMWNSMTSSMQLAEECAKQDGVNTSNSLEAYEGIKLFAQTIDSVLSRVKVKFIDTVFQVEHVPKHSCTGVGVTINIDLIEYSDEAGNDPTSDEATDLTNQESKKAFVVHSFTTKNFVISGVTFSTVEFSSKARTFSRSVLIQSQQETENDSLVTVIENSSINKDDSSPKSEDDSEGEKMEEQESKEDGDNQNLGGHRHVIKFGYLSSTQEVRVKLKQSENVTGPKVSIDVMLGSFIMFLSPRQFHLLLELADGLSKPDTVDNSNVAPRTHCSSKPMTVLDYQRVEQELQNQIQSLSNFQIAGLQAAQGWSSPGLDDSGTEETFLPLKNTVSGMYDSTLSGIASSMDSSVSSSMVSSVTDQSQRSRRKINTVDSDPTAEISYFQIRVASLAVILLLEDVLFQPVEKNQILAPSSVQKMQQVVDDFFGKLGHFSFAAYGNKDFEEAGEVFNKACCRSHLKLLAAPVQIEGDEKTTSSAFSITSQLSAAKLEIHECMYNSNDNTIETVPLLVFLENTSPQNVNLMSVKPSVKLTFKHVEKTKSSNRRNNGPKSEVTLFLNKLNLELDITIVDRINALLDSPTICVPEISPYNPWRTEKFSDHLSPISSVESKMDLKVICPLVNVKLRFPIPDFRPLHDMNRVPWWKRHVRTDYLSLVFSDFLLQSSFNTNQACQEYSMQSRALEVFYYENENSAALPIAKTEFDDRNITSMQDVMSQIRLNVKLFPTQTNELEKLSEAEPNVMTTSFYGAFENQNNEDPGPFSAKKVVHESDTPHSKPQNDDTAELIIPGDKHEIEEFIKTTSDFAKIHIEVFLPTVSIQLKSKHTYELIYNRINNDLLLWTPSAPKLNSPLNTTNYSTYGTKSVFVDGRDTFTMCKSGIQYESESDSEDSEETNGNNVFFSTYDHKTKLSSKSQLKVQEPVKQEQSEFVLNIQIYQGILSMNPPVRDSGNNVIPGQQGEFVLNLDDANIFVVSGYKGDTNLGFVCVQLHNAQLYHCDMMSIPTKDPPLKEIGCHLGHHLSPTIFKSEPGMLATSKDRGGNREMFTVAVRIQANHETHHVKTVRVALGLNKSTLKHRMCTEPNSWISHLLDFFNVQDYPLANYHAKDVLTELHLHVWDCAIDYRPLNLPIRSAISIGNFSMSSHLSAQANSSTLRFIFEECSLFLSEKAPPKNGKVSLAPVDLVKDYVNVLELGLFELSLRTTDKRSGRNPHIDLRASNNILNIHTCSDSGRMLMQLIVYFANDGDLIQAVPVNNASPYSSPRHQADQELVPVEPQISNLSKSQHEHVNTLLGEAMKENEVAEGDSMHSSNLGAKLFYFPDEKQLLQETLTKPLPQVTYELGDIAYHSNKSSDTDDDFCIISKEPGLGLYPANGIPEIRWLSSDPVRVIDNHFGIPVGKTDILKPPKSFPTPVTRYTLCDMTVTWHMYGGNDFKIPDSESKKKNVQFSETQLSTTVSFSKSNKNEVTITSNFDKKKTNMNWILKGGVNRDHDVHMELHLNKVRFQHEVYPETTTQASRQILIISDVEIVDKLESSQFNKFLYQYTSQTRPKQSHAHMVVIKALHIRPDAKLPTQECCLKVSLLPLRLNIDQDSLLFLINFFTELGGDNSVKNDEQVNISKHNTPTHQPPVMTISEENEEIIKKQALKVVDENLIMLMEESKSHFESENSSSNLTSSVQDGSPVFFRNLIFGPDVPIRLDYHGKRVDMTHGSLSGLLMGLGQLNCSELRLKRVSYRHGLLGFDKLMKHLVAEWLSDIKKNQLPSLLGGVGPMHTLVQLFQGVRDLFWLPIEQYQKDGRIVRGLQRGANSFTTSTAMAALELTSRIIHLIQITAETAYDMLSPGPSVRMMARTKGKRKRYNQPQDIREGMANAYSLVKEGIGETADQIVQVAAHEKEQKGYSGAVGGVLRQIPPTFLTPIIIASAATSNVLGGMRSQLVPDARREANQKWRNVDELNCDKK